MDDEWIENIFSLSSSLYELVARMNQPTNQPLAAPCRMDEE